MANEPSFGKYDALDTRELEALLRADLDAPEAERMDIDAVIYISELLAAREQAKAPEARPNAEAALADFYANYYPEPEEAPAELPEDEPKADKPVPFYRRWQSVAAVLLLCVGALMFYSWVGSGSENPGIEIIPESFSYAEVVDMLPKWLPEGYAYNKTELFEGAGLCNISAQFCKENAAADDLYIDICVLGENDTSRLYPKDALAVSVYTAGGIDHYIISRPNDRAIVWRNGSIEGSITGGITVAEAKQIVDSIYAPEGTDTPAATASVAATLAAYEDIDRLRTVHMPYGYTYGYTSMEATEAQMEVASTLNATLAVTSTYSRKTDDGYELLQLGCRQLTDHNPLPDDPATAAGDIYESHGTEHYIMAYAGQVNASWRVGDAEYWFSGSMTLDEAEQMIDSLYE